MNDTTSPKHPPLSHDQAPPGASHAQCGGGHAECFECSRRNHSDVAGAKIVYEPADDGITQARLLVHLPPDAMDRPLLWSKVLGDDESERIVAKEALRRLALAATAGSKT